MGKDYYNILGIQKGATDEEIKKAYRSVIVMLLHNVKQHNADVT